MRLPVKQPSVRRVGPPTSSPCISPAEVASVSGAIYTSDAYLTSLQAAIDKAGI
jgi:hypothetical protein